MINYKGNDPLAVLDPVVVENTPELIEALEDINPAVLKEVLIEKIKSGITQRQHDLLWSVLLRSSL